MLSWGEYCKYSNVYGPDHFNMVDEGEFDHDLEHLRSMFERGYLLPYGMFNDGVCVAYMCFLRFVGIHHARIEAMCESFYVAPSFRGGTAWIRLIRYSIGELKAAGVQYTMVGVRHQKVDFGPILKKLGFNDIETIWSIHHG